MAAFTRITGETVLVNRLGPLMTVAEMATTIVGTNSDCDDPLAYATRAVGNVTADFNTVTDAELALVATADLDDLLTVAEWRLLKNLLGAFNEVDIKAGPRDEKMSQFSDKVQKMLDDMEPTIEALGLLTAPMTAGYISLDFAEHNEARV